MSYRITARDYRVGKNLELKEPKDGMYYQIYGNNDFPSKLREYLINHGAELDGDDCFMDYEVTDINTLFDVMFQIHNEQVKDDSYWYIEPPRQDNIRNAGDLLDMIDYTISCKIALTFYNFYKAIEECIEYDFSDPSVTKYKIKQGKHIYLSGY